MRFLLLLVLSTGLLGQDVIWSVNNPSPLRSNDKMLHLVAGASVGIAGFLVATLAERNRERWWVWVLAAGILAAVAKELHDVRTGGQAEVADALNTVAGAAVVSYSIKVKF